MSHARVLQSACFPGDERFRSDIKTTAYLQHPHLLPLKDGRDPTWFARAVPPTLQCAAESAFASVPTRESAAEAATRLRSLK